MPLIEFHRSVTGEATFHVIELERNAFPAVKVEGQRDRQRVREREQIEIETRRRRFMII